jgi:queuosine precursor transporter
LSRAIVFAMIRSMNELIFAFHLASLLTIVSFIAIFRLPLLEAVFIFCCVAANVFVLKQIHLFGLEVTAADVYSVGAMLSINLLQEFHPRFSVNKLIEMTFIVLCLLAINSLFHLNYLPSLHDSSQTSYQFIFFNTPRFVLASLGCFIVSTLTEAYLFNKLKMTSLPLWMRALLAMIVGQTLDTGLFTLTALYNVLDSLFSIFIFSLTIKFLTIIASVPTLSLTKKLRANYV